VVQTPSAWLCRLKAGAVDLERSWVSAEACMACGRPTCVWCVSPLWPQQPLLGCTPPLFVGAPVGSCLCKSGCCAGRGPNTPPGGCGGDAQELRLEGRSGSDLPPLLTTTITQLLATFLSFRKVTRGSKSWERSITDIIGVILQGARTMQCVRLWCLSAAPCSDSQSVRLC
jgi:hypothetical protein